MIVYNLFPLLAGPFPAWEPHIERAAEMGFDWVFVNPVQLAGASRSLYSIADHFRLDPRFAGDAAYGPPEQQLRERLRSAEDKGMRVMVDLVINHCAIDSPLVERHPEWFAQEDGRIALASCMEDGKKVVWKDLARFDPGGTRDPQGLRRFFQRIIDHLIGLGFRGFRCDAAYQVPPGLWGRLIRDTKSRHPEVVFVAETLGCTADETYATARAGFDYVFNSVKWWDFRSPWLLEQYQLVREGAPSIGFPESHDTERLFAESQGNAHALRQRYLLAATFSAGVLMPIGMEFGFRKRLHVVETRPSDWEEPQVDLRRFIRRVNDVKRRFAVFQSDCPTSFLSSENPAVLVMWKASMTNDEEALVLLNTDTLNRQHFRTNSLRDYMQAGAPLTDVSPEAPMDFLPRPFEYELSPGEGRILVAHRR